MATAYPFEPLWELEFSGIVRRGQGLLPRDVVLDIGSVKRFSTGPITVLPGKGQIMAGSQILVLTDLPDLVWFRRMSMDYGTHDPNTSAPDCLWYGVGLGRGSDKVGYRIMPDGRFVFASIT